MLTKVISLKDYRLNITSLWKEALKKKIRYIVLFHSKPILEVKPYMKKEIVFDDKESDSDYHKTLEQNMDFWNDPADDNIFT